MMHITKIITLIFLILVSQFSYGYSNDPKGMIFIERSSLDIVNCGPVAAVMLSNYVRPNSTDKNISKAIAYARKSVQKHNGEDINYRWWTNGDIKRYLRNEKINFRAINTIGFNNKKKQSLIISAIKKGSAVLVNVNMNHLPSAKGGIGKPYFTLPFITWTHFLVIVGFEDVNGRVAYQLHDSFSKKGKNRLFYADNMNKAIGRFNPEIVVIEKR
jgi:hypothetical protein